MKEGTLYIVATPIGNLADISERAKEILSEVDAILAEDTRHTGKLLAHLGVKTKMVSYHDHNEKGRVPEIIERLKQGEKMALVSDAGTPCISDPGYRIVHACREEGVSVSTAPGPNAALAALSISGLPTDRFTFEGFLPPKGAKRTKRIEKILASDCTSIVYESTHKIQKLVDEVAQLDPERKLFIARELTKMYEETLHGTASEIAKQISERKGLKGEIVVIFERVSESKN